MAAPIEGTTNGSESNGRVTLAVLGSKIDDIANTVADLVSLYRSDHDKLTQVCTKFEDIDTIKKAIIGNVIAAIGAILAAIYALVKS